MDDSGESEVEFTIAGHSYQLIDTLSDIDNEQKREEAIRAHINTAENEAIPPCPEFPPNLQWFNTSRPLFFADDLRGKVVVLDFFTYCCINCLHILPDLHRLENTYSVSEGLVVIGIHSAKFEYEKVSNNILSAVLRYDITHPVVNDSETCLWNALDIQCWPSLVLLSPAGRPLLQLAGEDQMQLLSECIHVALSIYKDRGELNLKDDLPLRLSRLDLPSTPLCFPGKVTLDEAGKRLAISDTGHHRILVTDLNGVVLNIVGCGRDGHMNGKLSESRLNAPQGVAWKDNSLFIADTKNHVIRYANLDDDKIVTIVGTGVRGRDLIGGGKNTHQAISSPFDLILTSSVGSVDKDLLVIAMAGSHQIWLYFLSDGNWLKGQSFTRGTCVRFAGSGAEENRNNCYPHRAAFAQPSGITLHETATSRMLYIADSESSSVRQVSLTDGTVKALVGATREPQNLFSFGDVDGTGTTAKLQHPLGVAMEKKENPRLLVADSYNCKVKAVDVTTRQCVTLLGLTGCEAALRTRRLNEPGGLDVHPRSGIVYIADTNNHCIRRFNPALGTLTEMLILGPETVFRSGDEADSLHTDYQRLVSPGTETLSIRPVKMALDTTLQLVLYVVLGACFHPTEGAPLIWQISVEDEVVEAHMLQDVEDRRGTSDDYDNQPVFAIRAPAQSSAQPTVVRVECITYFCDEAGACRMKALLFEVPFLAVPKGTRTSQVLNYVIGTPQPGLLPL